MLAPTSLKFSTRVMYDEFIRQNTPVRIIDAYSSLLEYRDSSGSCRLLFSTLSDRSSAAGLVICDNKLRTERVARELQIPVPEDVLCTTYGEASIFLDQYKNIVLKPLDCSGGDGVSINITDQKTLRIAYDHAKQYGSSVIAQQHINGLDIRLLVVAGTFRSAIERRPAYVTGDGRSTVRDLITKANLSTNRASNYMGSMCPISITSSERHLQDSIEQVPASGTNVSVIGPASISLGGSAHEATHVVSLEMIGDAEKMARKLGLAIAGVDMIWNETTNQYALIEVNATPGVGMHNSSLWGTSSNAIEKYVSWLADAGATMN